MKRKVSIWIIGALLVIGVIGNIFGGGSAKTAQQASVSVPTAVAQPTPIPAPTTALPTLVPTAPPLPTTTSKSQMQAYIQSFLPDVQLAGTGLNKLGALTSSAGQTPALLTDATWQTDMLATLASLKIAAHGLEAVRAVPPGAAALDAELVSMGGDLDYIVNETATGMDTLQAAHFKNAAARLGIVAAKSGDATAEIKRLTGQ